MRKIQELDEFKETMLKRRATRCRTLSAYEEGDITGARGTAQLAPHPIPGDAVRLFAKVADDGAQTGWTLRGD